MFQVGQILTLNGTLVAGVDMRYVWKFWDGTSQTTRDPYTAKVLNKGGTQVYEMWAVDAEANTFRSAGTIFVNSPPVITSLSLTDNDSPSPFETTLTSAWLDPEGNGRPIVVQAESLGTTIVSPGQATFGFTVNQTKTIILSGTDVDGGITRFPIELRVAPVPLINAVGTTDPPVARIGPVETIRLTAFAEDQNGAEIQEFRWQLLTTNGWASNRTFNAPGNATVFDQGGGSFSSFLDISIAGETAGDKTIILRAATTQSSVEVNIPVTLLANANPIIEAFAVSGTVGYGATSSVSTTAIDPDGDLMSFSWSFHRPLNTIRVGNPVSVALTEGSVIEGTVTVSDVYGGLSQRQIPRILIISPLTAVGVRSVNFTYTLMAMGYSPTVFSVSGLPLGLSFNGSIISGIPQAFGNVDVILTASNADGTDSRTLKLVIAEFTPPPLPPTNLRVQRGNGNTDPTYNAQQNIPIFYTLTNDLPNLENPGAVIELRNSSGVLKSTITTASGVQSLVITQAQIKAAFANTLPSVLLRVYSIRAGVLSEFYQELFVTRV
jgi:hypothetical protein